MIATDIEFNGIKGADFGVMLCSFDGAGGLETVQAGAEINLNQISSIHGDKWFTTEVTYDAPLEKTFQICRTNCNEKSPYFDLQECREITRWLTGPKTPRLLRILCDETGIYDQIVFEGQFSVYDVKFNDMVIGFELKFTSNKPYAMGLRTKKIIDATKENFEYSFYDYSDEVGYIYPEIMTIAIKEDCDVLSITNSIENRTTEFYNCKAGEIITITDKLFISSSLSSSNPDRKIQNNFNYKFFRIANSLDDRLNKLTISSPCKIEFVYHPIVKGVGL